MALPERIRLEDFPNSPYARELRRGVGKLGFATRLEDVYQRVHLMHMRVRIRLWISLIAAISLADALLRAIGLHGWYGSPAPAAITADVAALVLGSVVWSRQYTRLYLPLARLMVPVSAASVAVLIAHGIGAGQGEQLAILVVNVLAIFFFTGLLFRAAVVASLALFAAFLATMLMAVPVHPTMLPSLIAILMTLLLCIIGYRDIEYLHRRSFLESALIGELVARDELSGLTNRSAFDEHLLALWHQAQREERTLAILMVDIDHFKAYNDSYGHQAGDAALRTVARLLKGLARRPLDLAGRYGGDEFVAVLYDLPRERVEEIAERLRQAVQQVPIDSTNPPPAPITISLGVGVIVPGTGRSMQGAVQLADEALYEAKQSGRNRVVVKGMEEYRRLETGAFRSSVIAPV